MDIKVIGIDLAKSVFQVCGMDEKGKVILRQRLSRAKLCEFMANLPACLVGMESCGGSSSNIGHVSSKLLVMMLNS